MPRSSIVSRIVHDTFAELPRPAPLGTRWWETLPLTFSTEHERFSLALRDALPVRAGATSDVVLRTLGACLIGGLAAPLGYRPKLLRQSFDDVKLYGPMAESGDATRFFARPPHHVAVETHRARLPLNRPKDGLCEDLHFESPFVPVNPGLRKKYLANERNRRAHVRLWRHHDGPRPTVIAVHGFSADLYHLNEWFFALPWLYAVGCDVALFTMPFHGKRQSRTSPFSGHGFFAGGASHINEAFGQAICDLRVLIDHLVEERGVPRVGITGVSLGGFTSALLAAVEPRLAFALPNVPVTSIPDLVLEWQPMGAVVRTALAVTKRSIVDVRYMLAVSSPLTYQPVIGRERLMIIGGVGDRLAPPKHARLLWEHWDRCRLHWFPGNHLIHLDRGAYLRETGKFLGGLGFFEGLPPRVAE